MFGNNNPVQHNILMLLFFSKDKIERSRYNILILLLQEEANIHQSKNTNESLSNTHRINSNPGIRWEDTVEPLTGCGHPPITCSHENPTRAQLLLSLSRTMSIGYKAPPWHGKMKVKVIIDQGSHFKPAESSAHLSTRLLYPLWQLQSLHFQWTQIYMLSAYNTQQWIRSRNFKKKCIY